MQLSKKRLTELCSNGTFEEVHSTLESEQGITIPKMTLKNAIKNCGNCTHKVYIYPDLNVYSCTCLDFLPIGNLKKDNLCKILLSENSKKFINYSPKLEKTCMECKYLELCNGGCIGTAFKAHREFGHGDPRCPKINKQ